MPRVPVASDLAPARLDPHMRSPAQLDRSAIAALGAARSRIGDSISALGAAFGEVAARASAAQDAQNYANAKLETLKGEAMIFSEIEQNVGEDGALWQTVPERLAELNKSVDEKYPISDPRRAREFQLWRETRTFERGMTAARNYQSAQRGLFLRGFDQDLAGVEQRIGRGEVDQTSLFELHSALTEKLEGMAGTVLSRSEVDARKREINARLMGAFDQFLSKDPDARSAFWEQVRKGKYEIDQPGYTQGGPIQAAPGEVSSGLFRAPGLQIETRVKADAPYMRRARDVSNIRRIIVHGDVSESVDNLVSYGQKVDRKRGFDPNYHFYIARDGRIIQGVPLDRSANHTKGANSDSIGIVIAGADNGKMPTPEQEAAAKQLVASLGKTFGIDPRNVVGHGELQPNRRHKLEGGTIAAEIRANGYDGLVAPGQAQDDNRPVRVASLTTTATDATVAEDVPPVASDAVSRLAQLAAENPDRPLREVVSEDEMASIRERVVAARAMGAEEFDAIAGDSMTVGEALDLARTGLEGSGLTPQQAISLFTGDAQQQPGRTVVPEQPFPMGRLVEGQTFTVKTKQGTFTIPAEWINSVDAKTRQAFATRAREAARIAQKDREIIADQMMEDQERHVEMFGSDAPDYDLDGIRAVYANNPKKVEKHLRKVEAARQVAELMKEAPKLREDDLERRVEELRPREGTTGLAEQTEVYERARQRVDKLIKQRREDPAAAVEGTPSVQAVREALQGGQPRNRAESFRLIDARLNAQRLLQIAPQNRRALTKAEAEALAEPLRNISEGRAEQVLRDLNTKVVRDYGSKYSGVIMRQLVETALNEQARRDLLIDLLAGMDDSGTIAPTDLERAREKFRLQRMERALEPMAEPEESRDEGGSRAPFPLNILPYLLPSNRVMNVPIPEPRMPRRTPPKQAIKELKANPHTLEQFERTFGLNPGEGRKYLLE